MEKMTTDLFTSLNQARDFVFDHSDKGCICPCCQQIARVYRWSINNQMAVFMLWLDRNKTGYYRDFIREYPMYISKVYSIPKHWGLIEKDSKKGYWRLTYKGKKFIAGLILIPKFALVFDDTVLGYSEERTTFDLSLVKKFDLKEILS